MKKAVICVLLAFTMIFASGCRDGASEVSDQMYEYGIYALEVTDDYLNGKITYSEADRKLDTVHSRAADLLKEEEASSGGSLNGSKIWKDQHVPTRILLIKTNIYLHENDTTPMAKVRETRNNLAEMIGEKKI